MIDGETFLIDLSLNSRVSPGPLTIGSPAGAPRWRVVATIFRELRSEVGDAFRSVSSLLGGSTEGMKGKPDIVSRARTVKAVLDFAEASQRFQSRASRGSLILGAAIRPRQALTRLQVRSSGSGSFYMYVRGYI
jgi:hypothetical protein